MNAKQVEMTEDEFEEYLNDCYEPVSVCGMQYEQGRILRKLDPIAFRCAMSDHDAEEWECEECGKRYSDEESANECCSELADSQEYEFETE